MVALAQNRKGIAADTATQVDYRECKMYMRSQEKKEIILNSHALFVFFSSLRLEHCTTVVCLSFPSHFLA